MSNKTLIVTSTAFGEGGFIPVQYTGYGNDQSPPLSLSGIVPEAKSIAVIMVDLDIPFIPEYPHWLIWNLPVQEQIPSSISKGELLTEPTGACQGLAYGKHEYAGPKPPKFIRKQHRYRFTVYVLDTMLDISSKAKRNDLLKAMEGHILQEGTITGVYKNGLTR